MQTTEQTPLHPVIHSYAPSFVAWNPSIQPVVPATEQHDPTVVCILNLSSLQQLKANVREMDTTRRQVQVSELPEFDRRVAQIKQEAQEGVSAVRDLQRYYSKERRAQSSSHTGLGSAGGLGTGLVVQRV